MCARHPRETELSWRALSFRGPILLGAASHRRAGLRLAFSLARDLRAVKAVELWKLRKDIGVVRASLADVLAQAEAARRAVDQLRWLLRDDEQAVAAGQQIAGALDRVRAAIGQLCDSAGHLQEAAKSTTADVTDQSTTETADIHLRRR